eukprot:RCo003198
MGCANSRQVAPAAYIVTATPSPAGPSSLTSPQPGVSAMPSSHPPPSSCTPPVGTTAPLPTSTIPFSAPPAPPATSEPPSAGLPAATDKPVPSSPALPYIIADAPNVSDPSPSAPSPTLPPRLVGGAESIVSSPSRECQLAQLLSQTEALRAGAEAFLRCSPAVEELVALKAALGGVIDPVVTALLGQLSNSGLSSRQAEGLDEIQVHDRGRPKVFEEAVPVVSLKEALEELNLEAYTASPPQDQGEMVRLTNYLLCTVCDGTTDDSPEVHLRACPKAESLTPQLLSNPRALFQTLSAADLVRIASAHRPQDDTVPAHPFATCYTLESPVYHRCNFLCRNIHLPSCEDEYLARARLFVGNLDRELRALPPFVGTVFRGVRARLPASMFTPGMIVTWPSPSSTSADPQVARSFLGTSVRPQGTLFVVESSTGRDISAFSRYSHEAEVLFRPGCQFRVEPPLSRGFVLVLERALGCVLEDVTIVSLREVTLKFQDDVLPSLTPEDRGFHRDVIEGVFQKADFQEHLKSFVTSRNLPVIDGDDVFFMITVDGHSEVKSFIPMDAPEAVTSLIPVPRCSPSVLAVLLANVDVTELPFLTVRDWITHYLKEKNSPAAVWLVSWAAFHWGQRQVFEEFPDVNALWEVLSTHVNGPIVGSRVTELLEASGASSAPASALCSILRNSASVGFLCVVQWIAEKLERDALDLSEDDDSWSALALAVEGGHEGVVEKLLVFGANVNIRTGNRSFPPLVARQLAYEIFPGLTPLHIASIHGRLGIAGKLLKAGAEVDAPSTHQQTPLHWAASYGHLAVVQALIAAKANPDFADQDGLFPVTFAAHKGHLDVVKYLVSCEAKIGPQEITFAEYNDHEAIVCFLQQKLASASD